MSLATPTAAPTVRTSLDGWRGLAALTVLGVHAVEVFGWHLIALEELPIQVLRAFGRQAVLTFFLISGYCIVRTLQGNCQRHGHVDVAEYAIARVARVYPPLIGAILLCVALAALSRAFNLPGCHGSPGHFAGFDASAMTLRQICRTLAMEYGMTEVDGPLWTLYHEVRLYLLGLLAAIVIAPSPGLRRHRALVAAAFVGLLTYWVTRSNYMFGTLGGIWAVGGAFALYEHRCDVKVVLRRVAAVSLALVAGLLCWDPAIGLVQDGLWATHLLQLGLGSLYLAVIFWPHAGKQWLVARVAGLDDWCYSLYIVHWPLVTFWMSLAGSWMAQTLAQSAALGAGVLLFCLGFARVFAHVFEQPTPHRQALRRFLDGASKKAAQAGGPGSSS